MPELQIPGARLWYDDHGSGRPVVCLHSGWGRAVMPFDDAESVLGASYRIILPDRRGYGRSTPIDRLPTSYHRDAAVDLEHFLAGLHLDRPILWGHSDGAITAALFAAVHPERVAALVIEAIHFHRAKSREFFAKYARDPDALPVHAIERLRADHGERWRTVIAMHSQVWLDFHEIGGDFYEGALESIRCPTLLLYGESDPHTPPREVAELATHLRHATVVRVVGGGHSPHSEPRTARFCSERVLAFLREHSL